MLSLKDKTIHGVSWSFADNIIGSGITFLIGLVLARLLSPDEFGIIGMITIFIAISNTIVDSGFSNALIRRKEVQDIDYNTVFYLNIVFSIFLYVIIFISAPAISVFFKEPQLTSISRVIGVILIINAFSIVQRVLLIRKVDFKTQTKISLISSLTSGVIGIGMAFAKFGVWSLVGQLISRQLMNALFLWLFNHWRPKFEFSIRSFKELYSFGSKLLIATLIDTLW
ncbi:MAG: oligosaccharide flippase family protein, partial [Bacteroidales bacterium]|nr:oligosaccharide flippase family protein [Bacteroidales bacterium]